jgi:hypothetical protein
MTSSLDERRRCQRAEEGNLEVVEEWRASPPFKEGVERIRDLIDGFEPGTYEVSAEVSASSSR